jgi:hypothetical protein
MAVAHLTKLRTSSEVYDDAVSALRSDNVPLDIIKEFISKMKFHVATAKRYALPFLTSEGYIINHSDKLEIKVIDLSSIELEAEMKQSV